MDLTTVVEQLDDELQTTAYADVDASANGLQIGPETGRVDRVAVAVDAAMETIDAAVKWDADLLVTHHGLIWGGIDRVTGRSYDRIASLIENDLSLYVSHLPLDGHPEHGNAAGIATMLDLERQTPFGTLESQTIGIRGRRSSPVSPGELRSLLAVGLDIDPESIQILDFGPDRISDVAIITGSGVDWLDEAVDGGADVFVTGEGKQHVYHEAKEAGITVVLAGHYATETTGVQSLADMLSSWGLETTFIDVPTGL